MYLESVVLLNIQPIYQFLEAQIPAFASLHNYNNLDLDYLCDVFICEAMQKVTHHLTRTHVFEHAYSHDITRLSDPEFDEVKWRVAGMLNDVLQCHRVSLQNTHRVKYIASRTALILTIVRKV